MKKVGDFRRKPRPVLRTCGRSVSPKLMQFSEKIAYQGFFVRSTARDIADSTTNTFMLLESCHYGWWDSAGTGGTTERVKNGSNPFYWVDEGGQGYVVSTNDTGTKLRINNRFVASPTRVARGDHPNGINVALCDASATFISNKIAFEIYEGMMTRAGGEAVSLP